MVPVDHEQRVLIADDEPAVLRALRRTLRRHGFTQVECFRDADAALQCHLQEAFDLAVFDLELPVSSGMSVVERIRGVDALLPVVFLTGDSTGPAALHACLFSAVIVEKPWDTRELISIIERLLAERAQARRFPPEDL